MSVPDDVGLCLTILKFSGTAVSAVMGVLGILTETREDVPGKPPGTAKRLSRWGKCALGLAIAGGVFAVGAQIAEEVKNRRESHDNEQHATDQIAQTQKVLQRLEEQAQQSKAILTNVQHQ